MALDWVDIWNNIINNGRRIRDLKNLDTMQMMLNGHVLYTKKDCYDQYEKGSIVDLVLNEGRYICKDCLKTDIELINKICPNKGVGEIKIVKPVFVFHLTDGKQWAVIGDELYDGDEYFLVKCEGKNNHVFMKKYVKYVIKQ